MANQKITRRQARENAFITLFQAGFGEEIDQIIQTARQEYPEYAVDAYGEEMLTLYQQHENDVNRVIEVRLKGWTAKRVARVNMALLRLAVTEMLYGQPDLHSVVINEAVELAKKYGDDEDYQFVNGVLGSISREQGAASSSTGEA